MSGCRSGGGMRVNDKRSLLTDSIGDSDRAIQQLEQLHVRGAYPASPRRTRRTRRAASASVMP